MTQEALFPMPQQGNTSDDYYTPKWIFESLGLAYDLDVACPPDGPIFTPSKAFYTQETDGLSSPWTGRVWMNPPYSKTAPWVDKWIRHGNGIALLPIVKHSKWTEQLWDSEAKCLWINRKVIKFHHKEKETEIFTIVWLWAIGQECIDALYRSNLGKVR